MARSRAAAKASKVEEELAPSLPASLELDPFQIAIAEAGLRPVPAWLEVIATQGRILVHSLPTRAIIDTQVTEQLIVELYSK